jgi:hypothetical protein
MKPGSGRRLSFEREKKEEESEVDGRIRVRVCRKLAGDKPELDFEYEYSVWIVPLFHCPRHVGGMVLRLGGVVRGGYGWVYHGG